MKNQIMLDRIRRMADANMSCACWWIQDVPWRLRRDGETAEEYLEALRQAQKCIKDTSPEHWILSRLKQECEAYLDFCRYGGTSIDYSQNDFFLMRIGPWMHVEAGFFLHSLVMVLEQLLGEGEEEPELAESCIGGTVEKPEIYLRPVKDGIRALARVYHRCLIFPETIPREKIRKNIYHYETAIRGARDLAKKYYSGYRSFDLLLKEEYDLMQQSRIYDLRAIDMRLREPSKNRRNRLLFVSAVSFYLVERFLDQILLDHSERHLLQGSPKAIGTETENEMMRLALHLLGYPDKEDYYGWERAIADMKGFDLQEARDISKRMASAKTPAFTETLEKGGKNG